MPDRSLGRAFVAIADAEWCRHTTVWKPGHLLAGLLYSDSGSGLVVGLPGAGDKPPRYILLFRLRTRMS